MAQPKALIPPIIFIAAIRLVSCNPWRISASLLLLLWRPTEGDRRTGGWSSGGIPLIPPGPPGFPKSVRLLCRAVRGLSFDARHSLDFLLRFLSVLTAATSSILLQLQSSLSQSVQRKTTERVRGSRQNQQLLLLSAYTYLIH